MLVLWREKIKIIEKNEARFNSKLNAGASNEEIRALNLKFNMKHNYPLPKEYLEILKVINGIDYNGFVLYGADSELLLDKPNQEIQGVIDSNVVWYEFVDPEKKYIFLGDDSISFYVYERATEKYWIIDRPSTDPIEEYQTVDELFNEMLTTALL
ncbi:YrhA family protein [Enterococcus sp. BWR-S5]|uniref:YrhA family protein n=1 Tax=Enterococcus sp. BWR-S5 TaxID=2787714 RepID=UPI001921BC71|nr:YrhA family protein [Enterococcus sp. BWR-S5]MBL1227059.1 SMI1/KNR4 family protein [Enterococcus sp. BWR-S5]